jgi:hypothetical protein
MGSSRKSLNYIVLLIFAPVLILTGIAGLLLPAGKGVTSSAAAYDIFHIVFGSIGLLLVGIKNEDWIRAFNIGFGLIDLYQAVASYAHLFPERYFRWTGVDDILHIVIGAGLVFVGLYGRKDQTSEKLGT